MILFGSLNKIIIGSVLLALVGGGIAALALSRREPAPELDRLPALVYSRAVDQVVTEVVAPPQTERMMIPPIPRDASEALRTRLAHEVEDRLGFEVMLPKRDETSNDEDLTAMVGALVRSWKEKIIAEWTGEKPEVLLVSRVKELTDDDERLRLVIEWEQQWVASGEPLAGGVVKEEIAKSWFDADYARASISDSSASMRFGIWLAVLVLPGLLLVSTIKKVLREESNSHNALLVLAFAIPASVSAWILTAFGAGWFGGGLTLLAIAASGAYSFLFCTMVEELRR